MGEKIVLHGNNDELLSISLLDILKLIINPDDYDWKILWINGVSNEDSNFNMIEFEEQLGNGYDISFKQLLELCPFFSTL